MPDRLIPVFPTTILHRRLEGMEAVNAGLIALVDGLRASAPSSSMGTTTEGGYQTSDDFFQRGDDCIVSLRNQIGPVLRDYANLLIRQECTRMPAKVDFVMWGWAVSYRAGDSQGVHVHPGANISGVYYASAPPAALEQGDAGKISFYDPRVRAGMAQLPFQATRHRQAPVPGDMFVFPSWLEHSVSPFQGEGQRLCIAFNAKLILE